MYTNASSYVWMHLCTHRQTHAHTLFVPDFANLSLDFRQSRKHTREKLLKLSSDQEIKASQLALFIQERGQGTDKCGRNNGGRK